MSDPRYKFYFDKVLVSDPLGWDGLATGIKRDNQTRGITITEDSTLSFISDAYIYLKGVYNTGFCNEVIFDIYESCNPSGNYKLQFTGIIFVSDVEFDLKKCIATTKIQDNSFYAKINNRKSVGVLPGVGKSVNGLDIDIPTVNVYETFQISDGTYTHTNPTISVFEILKFMIDYMTDDTLDFKSDILDSGGEFEGLCITTGITFYDQPGPTSTTDFLNSFSKKSFQEFFTCLSRWCNLGWWIENDIYGNPVFRVENNSFFYKTKNSIDINNIDGIIQLTAVDKLYSKITVGSNDTYDDPAFDFPEMISFLGFQQEEYVALGKCNIDTTLDLTGDLIISSNVFHLIALGDDSYNSRWLLIDVDINSGLAKQSNWIDTSIKRYYNEQFTNQNVINRYLGNIPIAIANYLTAIDVEFQAGITNDITVTSVIPATQQITMSPFPFDNEAAPNHDVGNVWNNSTYRFTSPLNDVYTFRTYLDSTLGYYCLTECHLLLYDDQGTLIDTIEVFTGIVGPIFDYSIDVYVPAKYYIECEVKYLLPAMQTHVFSIGSFFSCTGSVVSDSLLATFDPEKFPIINYKFSHPLTRTQIELIKSATNEIITFDDGKNFLQGWIQEIKVEEKGAQTEFHLQFSQRQI